MKAKFKCIVSFTNRSLGVRVCAGAILLIASSANAQVLTYAVDRSFAAGSATLVGTVSIPIGNYTIQNGGASPFTSVSLTLTVSGNSYTVDNVLTEYIDGTGEFIINASPTALTFSTANTDDYNYADLNFSDSTSFDFGDRYAIGSDGDPHFEAAIPQVGSDASASVRFPTVFATPVPEPTTLALAGMGGLAALIVARRRK